MAGNFHINSKGEPGRCSAQQGGCPFGSESEHYLTREGASAAYERSMNSSSLPTLTKAPTRQQVNEVLEAMSRGEDTIPEGIVFEEAPKKEIVPEPAPPTEVETLLSETPEQRQKRWAEVDARVHQNVVLFGQDEENLKKYNSFSNRVLRFLTGERKKVLSERDKLNSLPDGQKLIDYDPTREKVTVWTKKGENRWENGRGEISTNNDRKLPATIVE